VSCRGEAGRPQTELFCVPATATSFDFVLLTACGWVNRRQLAAIDYLREENQVLRAQLGSKRLNLTDADRRALAVKGRALGQGRLASSRAS